MSAPIVEMEFVCIECWKIFTRKDYVSSFDSGLKKYKKYRYCSRECMTKSHRGIPVKEWEENAQKKTRLVRGNIGDHVIQHDTPPS